MACIFAKANNLNKFTNNIGIGLIKISYGKITE